MQAILTADRRPVQDVTEWAKKPDCWTTVQTVEHPLSPELLAELDHRLFTVDRKRAAAATQRIDTGISPQVMVYQTQASQWGAVEEILRGSRQLSPTDA